MIESDRCYRPPEAWRIARVPRQMLYDALHAGDLKAIKRGDRYLISGSSLLEWITKVGAA